MKKKAKVSGLFRMLVVITMILSFLVACSKVNGNGPHEQSGASQDSNEITLFVDHPWWPYKDWIGKIPEEISKKSGIKVKVHIAADTKQLPLMIASGEQMPDLVFTYDNINQMTNPKVSYTWTELIKKYTPNLKIDPLAVAVNTAADGDFYTVRNGFSSPDDYAKNPKSLIRGGGLVVREDILQKLGNPPLNSLDDLVNVLKTVKTKYPKMIPLVMTPLQIDAYFRIQFGLPRFGFDEVNGQVKYFINHPGQYDYYMFMNKLYREGLIVPENFTWKDPNQASQYSLNGQAFAQEYDIATADQLNAQLEKDGKNFRFKQVIQPLGKNPRTVNHNPGWSGLFVPKNAKNPGTAMKFIEFMRSEEGQRLGSWGIEGEDYTMHKDGYPEFKYNTSDAGVTKKMGAIMWGLLSDSGVTEGLARYQPGKNQATPGMEILTKYRAFNPLLGVLIPKADSDEQIIKTNIDNLVKNEETKIYLAKSEEEAKQAYENMIKKANDIGLPKLEDWANKRYMEVKKLVK